VTRDLLDTNIISKCREAMPSPALAAGMSVQADEDLFISAITIAEVRRGIWEQLSDSRSGVIACPTRHRWPSTARKNSPKRN
jgi:predicted nucleic acid-binding protein